MKITVVVAAVLVFCACEEITDEMLNAPPPNYCVDGHSWARAYTLLKNPTCLSPGFEGRVCVRLNCEEYFHVTKPIPALQHEWGGWNLEIPPTALTPGKGKRFCVECFTPDTNTEIPILKGGE